MQMLEELLTRIEWSKIYFSRCRDLLGSRDPWSHRPDFSWIKMRAEREGRVAYEGYVERMGCRNLLKVRRTPSQQAFAEACAVDASAWSQQPLIERCCL